jgi:hypothetical protein
MEPTANVKPEIVIEVKELEDFFEDGYSFVVTCGSIISKGKAKNSILARKRANEIAAEIKLSFLKERRKA